MNPWRSCYFHEELNLFLIVYVDDFKMAGTQGNLSKGWQLLRMPTDTSPGIQMEDPTAVNRFLGCEHRTGTEVITWHGGEPTALDESLLKKKKQPDGTEKLVDHNRGQPREGESTEVVTMEYDMREFFRSCVALYADLTGTLPSSYPKVPTPFGPLARDIEDGLGGPEGREAEPALEDLACALGVPATPGAEIEPWPEPSTEETESGILQPIAARVLMKILYGARMARYDLLRAVGGLASSVTKWTRQCDADLYRLVCYINTTAEMTQVSWMGDEPDGLRLQIFVDADHASDVRTQRSTSGVVSLLVGNNTRFMLGASSRRQTAVPHSTPEAEIVAADAGLRTEALPALPLWEILLKREVRAEFKEDNEAVIKICRSGGSQKLMHMNKTHRVDAASIAEQFGKDKQCDLTDTHTQLIRPPTFAPRGLRRRENG